MASSKFKTRRFSDLIVRREGSAAVEFAVISPLLFALLFGCLATSWVLAVQHGLQQLAAESARAALAGMSATERDTIARSFVASTASSYAFLDPRAVGVSTQTVDSTMTFSVTTSYDLSRSPFYSTVSHWLPMSSSTIVRVATIRQGGFQ